MSSNVSGFVLAATLPANGAETVIGTAPAVVYNAPGGQGNTISGVANLTPGTSGTTAIIRVRQGTSTAGTLVQATPSLTTVAAAPIAIPFCVLDATALATASGAAGLGYVVTLQTNSTVAGTLTGGAFEVEPVTGAV